MPKTIKERIEYLENQILYYKSIGDNENVALFSAVVNELSYWQKVYE